ncbi:hypothetical protein ACW2Q0_18790 [Nocardia sp. R16R-3T]
MSATTWIAAVDVIVYTLWLAYVVVKLREPDPEPEPGEQQDPR